MHIDFACGKTVGESNQGYSYSVLGEALERGGDILSQSMYSSAHLFALFPNAIKTITFYFRIVLM